MTHNMIVRVKSLRWSQFSLRTLLGLTTLACVALAVYVGRQRYLEASVAAYNAFMDEQRYREAEVHAESVHWWYRTPLTEAMLEKAAFANAFARNQSYRSTHTGYLSTCIELEWFSVDDSRRTEVVTPVSPAD